MLLGESVPLYLSDMDAANLAATTRKCYGSWLRRLGRWLGDNAGMADITPVNLNRWIRSMIDGKQARPRTIKNAIHALRSFCSWAVAVGALTDNPALGLQAPRLDAARREVCTDSELADMLAACERLPDRRKAAAAAAAANLLAHAGLRRRELLGLKTSDILLADRCIVIRHGKGDMARRCYPHPDAIVAVRSWLRARGECRHDYLFDVDHSRRLGDQGLKNLLDAVAAVAGHRDSPALKPHSIRHNYATRLYRACGELETVREALGHTSLQTTAIYVHAGEERLRAVSEMTTLRPGQVVIAHAEPPEPPAERRRSQWRRAIVERTA